MARADGAQAVTQAALDAGQCGRDGSVHHEGRKDALMSQISVTVAPIQGGWSVLSRLSAGPLMFLTCDHAEEQARQLANIATKLGWDAEVRLHSREGGVSVRTFPATGAVTPMARTALAARRFR
jgi:hypothetical protein